jgi:hypothetical protein
VEIFLVLEALRRNRRSFTVFDDGGRVGLGRRRLPFDIGGAHASHAHSAEEK